MPLKKPPAPHFSLRFFLSRRSRLSLRFLPSACSHTMQGAVQPKTGAGGRGRSLVSTMAARSGGNQRPKQCSTRMNAGVQAKPLPCMQKCGGTLGLTFSAARPVAAASSRCSQSLRLSVLAILRFIAYTWQQRQQGQRGVQWHLAGVKVTRSSCRQACEQHWCLAQASLTSARPLANSALVSSATCRHTARGPAA